MSHYECTTCGYYPASCTCRALAVTPWYVARILVLEDTVDELITKLSAAKQELVRLKLKRSQCKKRKVSKNKFK